MPSLESMVEPNNTELLADTVNKMYKMYMTRVLTSSIFRTPMNESSSPSTQKFTGTVSTTVSRLRVNYKSKLVLQILLAVMTVLGVSGFFLTKIRGTVPRNPFSVASLMSLFSDSEFCNRKYLPEYAQWMTKGELEALLGTRRFSLGWWDEHGSEREDGKTRQRFGIGIGAPESRGFAKKKGKGGHKMFSGVIDT
ncbi:uncharacterized protein F4807DRAFT_468154 [Annulohypoxylon truncatum]|uniref:uncharacterized protein n=1 Tax=Annulohypoxylon truncatum TaxID=327061 RepID=UPI002007A00F|nr:uncharacterized protein F4807DRAFT_468154 [Annulohypoxylon truncatum]KAI1214226.1 hypothetical protein F4807DRAFT_468154 [Annulohypoxylon truncatum]